VRGAAGGRRGGARRALRAPVRARRRHAAVLFADDPSPAPARLPRSRRRRRRLSRRGPAVGARSQSAERLRARARGRRVRVRRARRVALTVVSRVRPDVLVDLTPLDTFSRFTGTGRYVRELALALAALSADERQGLSVAGLVALDGDDPVGSL